MVEAAIGIGSNLCHPEKQVSQAMCALNELPYTRVVACSRLYRSKPQGPLDQPHYVNACAVVETSLLPMQLLQALQQLEKRQGKVKKRHWGERIIDLDLLLYENVVMSTPVLTLPHPWLHRRDFVLVPLAEIAADWCVPGKGRVKQLLETLSDEIYIERCLDENT